MLFALLPIVAYVLVLLRLFLREQAKSGPYTAFRVAFVQTFIALSLLVFTYNETASAFSLITPTSARLFWLLACLGAAGWLWRITTRDRWPHQRRQLTSLVRLEGLNRPSRILVWAGIALLVLPLLLLAIYVPPNNFDSHQYHLSRILYWLADQNLDHYPTMHVQQLYHNVFAEYLVLHTFLLAGSDQFANLIQFVAMLGSVLAVSLLARSLGMAYRGQLLAGILMLTLPIGLFESTTTQNDYVACFFCIAFVTFGYRFLQQRSRQALLCCLLALTLGAFTKYTVLFFALPFVVYFGVRILIQDGIGFGMAVAGGAAGLFALVFGPFFARNYWFFGSPLGPLPGSRFYTEKIPVDGFSVAYSVSNTIKNAGLHLGLPYLPYNRWVDSVVASVHRVLGVAVADPAVSLNSYHTRFVMQEDMAPNTLHFALLVLAGLLLLVKRGHKPAKLMLLLTAIGFVLFSSTFKFQLYSSRTQMPFFALGCVVTAYAAVQILHRSGFWLALLLCGLALPIVLGNPAKMVVPVRYLSKRLLAHVPRDICPVDAWQQQLYGQLLVRYYRTEAPTACYPIRQTYGLADRRLIFGKLDSIGYFRADKSQSVLAQSRTQTSFTNHPEHYADYAPLLAHVGPDVQNVGVLFSNDWGIYHFWRALVQAKHRPVEMRYIQYYREYERLPNAHQPFRYNYVLANHPDPVKQIDPKTIAAVYTSGQLTLIRLNRPVSTTYPY